MISNWCEGLAVQKDSKASNIMLPECRWVGCDKAVSVFSVVASNRAQDARYVGSARRVGLQSFFGAKGFEPHCKLLPLGSVNVLCERPVNVKTATAANKNRQNETNSSAKRCHGLSGRVDIGIILSWSAVDIQPQ
jgi:hypothetical protein